MSSLEIIFLALALSGWFFGILATHGVQSVSRMWHQTCESIIENHDKAYNSFQNSLVQVYKDASNRNEHP